MSKKRQTEVHIFEELPDPAGGSTYDLIASENEKGKPFTTSSQAESFIRNSLQKEGNFVVMRILKEVVMKKETIWRLYDVGQELEKGKPKSKPRPQSVQSAAVEILLKQ